MHISGKAVIFCAPSGAGKTTIVKHLISQIPNLRFSVSATTRQKRATEEHGRDYYFLSQQDFKSKIEHDDLYEWQEVYQGLFYGTLKSEVQRIWDEGNHVIFDVDVLGAINLKKALGKRAKTIFVSVENIKVLESRLILRDSETEETLKMRIDKAAQEMETANHFDYILINRDLSDAVSEAEKMVIEFIRD
jgi:guanylate kinase